MRRPTVRDAAADAVASDRSSRLALWTHVQNLWYGLSLGSVLLLAAIGLAITFGVMGVINMAHGEMVMIGAYDLRRAGPDPHRCTPACLTIRWPLLFLLAFLVAGPVGVPIERTILPLYGRPLDTLLATWGVSLILQQVVRTVFGPTNREVGAPAFMSGAFELGELAITWNRLWIIVFAPGDFLRPLARAEVHSRSACRCAP